MKLKTVSLLLAVMMLASLSVVACGPGGAEFELSDLTISPPSAEVYEARTISVDVTNVGGANGSYTVNLSVDGTKFTDTVELDIDETQTVSFSYTPQEVAQYTVTVGELSDTFSASPSTEDYWTVSYNVVGGDLILVVSLLGARPSTKDCDFPAGTIDMLVSKAVTDGYREVIIEPGGWNIEPATVPDVQVGIDMDLTLLTNDNAEGRLYVEDGAGDVDITSESTKGPTPDFTFGDGTLDLAGDLLIDVPLLGHAVTTVGVVVDLPMPVWCTTGNTLNHVTKPDAKIDGSEVETSGATFAQGGGVAPYVGTAGTIATTGAALDQFLAGMKVDFQYEISMELEPAS